jgi:hypothetical protein
MWESNMRRFVERDNEAKLVDSKAPQGHEKLVRVSALDLIRALINALTLVGKPLARFQDGPYSHPWTLVLNGDEGSSNLAAFWFMASHLHFRTIFIRDPSHREWNDVKGALKQAGVWNVVLETTFSFNLPYGPWEGASYFHACKRLCSSYERSQVQALLGWHCRGPVQGLG